MLLSDRNGFAFLHVPKTGGSSVTAALAPLCDDPRPVPAADVRGWQQAHHVGEMHDRWEDVRPLLEARRRHFVFMFMRNPWDRAVSLWRHRRREGESFEEYLRRPAAEWSTGRRYTRPQTFYVRPEQVHFVGRFEHLEEDFAIACRRIGIRARLPHRNDHGGHSDYSMHYSRFARRRVDEIFADDIAALDYRFEDFQHAAS